MEQQSILVDPFASGTANLESSAGHKVGAGRYSLVRILGRGGMGIVWLAKDERLGCEVALKFLPPQIRYDASALDDLRRETARSHKLSHPNIVRVHDLYEVPGEDAFISMEYVDGRNLADLRVEQPARVFSWAFLKPVVEQLCAALEYAHSQRIIHRDLKPANLMLDSKRRFKLADFGIARTVSDTMSRISMNQTSGTLLYMSPQQMEGGIPHPTDDIYGIGAILYELLTGKPPFYTGDIMHQVRSVAPRPMRERLEELEVTNEVPCGIEQVIMACLAKNVSERPQTACEVARLLAGDKLKLLDTQARLDRSNTSHVEIGKQRSRKPKTWHWAIACGIVCGVGVWAIANNAKANVRKREAKQTQAMPSNSSPTIARVVATNTLVATRPVSPKTTPVTKNNETPSVAAQKPVVPVTQPIAARPAPVVPEPTTTKLAPAIPPKSNAETVIPTEPTATPKTDLRSSAPTPVSQPTRIAPTVAAAPATPKVDSSTSTAPAAVLSKATALQLLQKGNSYVSPRTQNRVLQMVSGRALVGEAPQNWRIVYSDDKATYNAVEVRFAAGEMERVFEPSRIFDLFSFGSPKTLDMAKVKIDSDQAIRLATTEFETEAVEIKFVELKLERGSGGLSVWNVNCLASLRGKLPKIPRWAL